MLFIVFQQLHIHQAVLNFVSIENAAQKTYNLNIGVEACTCLLHLIIELFPNKNHLIDIFIQIPLIGLLLRTLDVVRLCFIDSSFHFLFIYCTCYSRALFLFHRVGDIIPSIAAVV